MPENKAMHAISRYDSPLGTILLAADEIGLTGLWFAGQKHYGRTLEPDAQEQELPVFDQTKRWLDLYFSGQDPSFLPPIHPKGTAFQQEIWSLLLAVPYGETRTYGSLARELAEKRGFGKMSAQAVGGAVGRNPISILVPCHRILGAKGELTGYAGGIWRKKALLELEKSL